MKKLCLFLIFFLPWYIGPFIFPIDLNYYHQLRFPFFIPDILYPIVGTSIFLILAFLSTKIISTIGYSYSKEYLRSLFFSYCMYQLFFYFFFTMKSIFLGFTDSMILFISSLILYYETKEINPSLKHWLIPYLLLTIGSSMYLLITLFMNL